MTNDKKELKPKYDHIMLLFKDDDAELAACDNISCEMWRIVVVQCDYCRKCSRLLTPLELFVHEDKFRSSTETVLKEIESEEEEFYG